MPGSLMSQALRGLLLGAAATAALLVALLVLQTIALMAEGRSFSRAFPRAAGRTWAVVGGTVAALGIIITNGFGALDILTNSIASAPLAASQLVTILLGLLGLRGAISDVTFLIGAVAFAVFTVITREVRNR
ncbi:MAG: hypothetical protein ABEI57_00670 [Halapricum sp.]